MEIYIDILFLENTVINYLILVVTSKLSKRGTSNLRLFLGSVIGALYVVALVLFPSIKIYYNVLAKFALSLLIILLSFPPEKLRTFIRTLLVFYLSTFIFAGAAFAFLYFDQGGGFIRNGIVYVFGESKWTLIFLSVVTVGIIVKVFWEILQYKLIKDKLMMRLKIVFEKKVTSLFALVDTGNSLHDPLTNMPVVIVEFRAIKNILPFDIQNIFEQSKENDLNCVTDIISNSNWFSRFRLIPYTSLGMENGMLIGFRPDYIEIGENDEVKGINSVIVGIYNRALSKNERYKALLSPELI